MMNNLFSIFDPCTGMMSMNWISSMLILILLPKKFWIINNKYSMLFTIISKKLNSEVKIFIKEKGSTIIMISMFLFIMMNNMMGLLPYIFTSSSHLVFSMSLSLPIWTSLMMFGWMNKTNNMFSHLLPMSTPPVLMPFMIMIETISNIMRPGSLAVRLSANMIAGHLIMSLLGQNSKFQIMLPLMSLFMLLMMFELAVSIIQSYVFMTLSTLYYSEI